MQTLQETLEAQLGQLAYRCALLGHTVLELREDNARLQAQLAARPSEKEAPHG